MNGEKQNDGGTGAGGLRRLAPIVLSQIVGLACGVAGVKISSRWIAPDAFGAYGVFLTLTPLGTWVVHAGLTKFVARHWAGSGDRAGLLREVFAAAVKKLPLLAAATFAAAWLVSALAAGGAGGAGGAGVFGGAWWGGWAMLFAGAALMSAAQIAQAALQAGREHWKDLWAGAAGSVTRSFVPPLLYLFAGATLASLQAGFVMHAAVLALAAGCAVWKTLPARGVRAGHARQLAPVYEGPLFIMLAVAAWLLGAANRWIVAAAFGAGEAGYFTLAGNLTIIVTSMLAVVFLQYWQPLFFAMPAATGEERRVLAARVDRVAIMYAALALAGVAALRLAAPFLVGPLIDQKYASAIAMIAPAGCFGVAAMIGQFYHMMLLAMRRERACAAADIAGACVLIGGGVIAAALGGEAWFWRWLLITPAVPWLVQRTIARRRLAGDAQR